MQHMRSQRSFWMLLMWHTGSMRVTSFTETSGIHCMQAAWHHRSSPSAGLSAPPETGHRQHCGATLSCSCSTQKTLMTMHMTLMYFITRIRRVLCHACRVTQHSVGHGCLESNSLSSSEAFWLSTQSSFKHCCHNQADEVCTRGVLPCQMRMFAVPARNLGTGGWLCVDRLPWHTE